jgi:hypothetical protein
LGLTGRRACASSAGAFFSLIDENLKLGTEDYSPQVLEKIEYAGGNHGSFQAGSSALAKLAEVSIQAKHVQRVTERLGRERMEVRDAEARQMEQGELRPPSRQPPATVAIHLDAGKMQFRAADAGRGVHDPRWGDTKVACLQSYTAVRFDKDPQPDPPKAFLDPSRVERLCREMERVRGKGESTTPRERKCDKPPAPRGHRRGRALRGTPPPSRHERRRKRPQRVLRTVVATTRDAEAFGWMVAAEAMLRGFYAAAVCALVGDGGNWIGPLGDLHFPDWLQILDFPHLLVHLYAAARLSYINQPAEAWKLYEQMLRDAWAGRAQQVLQTLETQANRLGPGPPTPKDDPRNVLRRVVEYVRSNLSRMDYPQYRRLGLPVASAQAESLIKQINQRVKGSEKFWVNGGAEAILQVRAAYLSEDDRGVRHHAHRPRGPAVGRNRRHVRA